MQTIIQVVEFSEGLGTTLRQFRNGGNRYLTGSSLRFELHYTLEDNAQVPSFAFAEKLLEENFANRVFADSQDPHIDWFRMGEKLGVLRLTVIPNLSYPTLAFQVYQLINEALIQLPRGISISEVRIFNHNVVVSYAKRDSQ